MWALCAMESNWTSKIKHMYVFPVTQQFYFKIYTKKNANMCSQKACVRMIMAVLFIKAKN